MNYTPQEKKAQKLWATYDDLHQQLFWMEYESLLTKTAHTETVPPPPVLVQPTSKKTASETEALYSYDINKISKPIAGIIATVSGIIAIYAYFSGAMTTVTISTIVFLFFTILYAALDRISFEVFPDKLIVKGNHSTKTDVIPWAIIDNIRTQDQVVPQGEGHTTVHMITINTYHKTQYRTFSYEFELPPEDRQALLTHLRQYVKHVHTS
jgi:hypothetical protein